MTADGVAIEYLADHAGCIPTLARWHAEQWSALAPEATVDRRIERLRLHLNKGAIPTTLVALGPFGVVGSASLVDEDMHGHRGLSPWLSSVYVAPAYRGQGIGSALTRRVAREAFALGVMTLYLFTPDQEAFYGRLGWKAIERTRFRGHPVVVMALSADSGEG